MITKNNKTIDQIQMVSIEQLVPQDHILRKIDAAIDFDFIYDLVEERYCPDNGRPSIDPVVLIKIAVIQYMFGIKSMRQTIKDIEVNIAYRFEGTDLFEQIFQEILMQCMKNDLVSTDEIFVDATHVKAAASRKKSKKILVAKKNARFYDDMLREEMMLSRLFDTFFSRTLWAMLLYTENHSISVA